MNVPHDDILNTFDGGIFEHEVASIIGFLGQSGDGLSFNPLGGSLVIRFDGEFEFHLPSLCLLTVSSVESAF